MKLPGATSFLLLISCFLAPPFFVAAQSPAEDSLFYQKATDNLVSRYHQAIKDQSGLYNGIQYGGYTFVFREGHAFFDNDKMGMASLVYDGVLYQQVMLQYDEIQEAVIIEDASLRIQLLNERLSKFSVFNNTFVRIVKDSSSNALLNTGFYNVLYDGKNSLLKKEVKTIREDITTDKIIYYVDVHRYHYIKKAAAYYAVNSKKNVLSILGDKKKDIQQYIRKNKLSFRKDRDNMLVKVMAYYDQLINN